MTHGHKIFKCSCGEIILQCRCMMENKPVVIVKDGCKDCEMRAGGFEPHQCEDCNTKFYEVPDVRTKCENCLHPAT